MVRITIRGGRTIQISHGKNQNAGNAMEKAKPLQPPQEKKSSLDLKMEQLADMHMSMMKSHDKFENETRTSLNNQAAQLQNLEV